MTVTKTESLSPRHEVSDISVPPSSEFCIAEALRFDFKTKQSCVVSLDDDSSLHILSDAFSSVSLMAIIVFVVGTLLSFNKTKYSSFLFLSLDRYMFTPFLVCFCDFIKVAPKRAYL